MKNQIVTMLRDHAQQHRSEPYKARAYRNAADTIESLRASTLEIIAEQQLWHILPHIGTSISAKIRDMSPDFVAETTRHKRKDVAWLAEIIISTPGLVLCGSYRREKDTLKDLDVVSTIQLNKVELPDGIVTVNGDKKKAVVIKGITVELNYSHPRSLGAAMLHHTGSADFNIRCRKYAKTKGWLLNQYGLFNGMLVLSANEAEILNLIGVGWLPPCKR